MVEYIIQHYKRLLQKDYLMFIDCIYGAIQNNNLAMLKLFNYYFDLTYSKSQNHFASAADNKYYDICEWLFMNGFPLPSNIKCNNMLDNKIQEIISETNWWFTY